MAEANQPGLLGSVKLIPERRSVGQARSFTRHALRAAGLEAILGDVELVVSELVTNAVAAASAAEPDNAAAAPRSMIELRLRRTTWSLLVAVWDRTPMPPTLKDPSLDAESGRGLYIVTQLCESWNYFYPAHGGKLVWAEFAISRG